MLYLSHYCQMCHNFQYFGQHILNFLEKIKLIIFFHLCGFYTDPDRANLCGFYTDPDRAK
jgi:hypothetical protein